MACQIFEHLFKHRPLALHILDILTSLLQMAPFKNTVK